MNDGHFSVRLGSILAAAALLTAACASDTAESATTTIPAEPNTTATALEEPRELNEVEADALERVEGYWPALHEGRIDDIATLFGGLSDEDRLLWEANAILAEAFPRTVHGCEVTQSVGSIVSVECLVTYTDPVHEAEDVTEIIYPFQWRGDRMTWQTWRIAGGLRSPGAAPASYAAYLEQFHGEEFAASCSPASYTGDFVYNGHIVIAPPCAELMVTHAEDVAAWVEAGKPTP